MLLVRTCYIWVSQYGSQLLALPFPVLLPLVVLLEGGAPIPVRKEHVH
jgi:hypothetical protein